MQITLTWTTVIAAAGGIAALVAIIGYLVKVIVWFQRQKQQDVRADVVHHPGVAK